VAQPPESQQSRCRLHRRRSKAAQARTPPLRRGFFLRLKAALLLPECKFNLTALNGTMKEPTRSTFRNRSSHAACTFRARQIEVMSVAAPLHLRAGLAPAYDPRCFIIYPLGWETEGSKRPIRIDPAAAYVTSSIEDLRRSLSRCDRTATGALQNM